MNLITKINKIFELIESNIRIDKEDLLNIVSKNIGYERRDLAKIFMFLTDISIGEYIRRRKITLAYYDLMENNKNIVTVAMDCGYGDQPAFTKAFKNVLGSSPGKLDKVDENKLQKPFVFDELISEDKMNKIEKAIKPKSDVVFGIDKNLLQTYNKIMELCAEYDIPEDIAQIGYEFSTEYDIDIETAIDFIDIYNDLFYECNENAKEGNKMFFANHFVRKDIYEIYMNMNDSYLESFEAIVEFIKITDKYNIDAISIYKCAGFIMFEYGYTMLHSIVIAEVCLDNQIEVNDNGKNKFFLDEFDYIICELNMSEFWSENYASFKKEVMEIVDSYEEFTSFDMELLQCSDPREDEDYYEYMYDENCESPSGFNDSEYDSLFYGYGDLEDDYD